MENLPNGNYTLTTPKDGVIGLENENDVTKKVTPLKRGKKWKRTKGKLITIYQGITILEFLT